MLVLGSAALYPTDEKGSTSNGQAGVVGEAGWLRSGSNQTKIGQATTVIIVTTPMICSPSTSAVVIILASSVFLTNNPPPPEGCPCFRSQLWQYPLAREGALEFFILYLSLHLPGKSRQTGFDNLT